MMSEFTQQFVQEFEYLNLGSSKRQIKTEEKQDENANVEPIEDVTNKDVHKELDNLFTDILYDEKFDKLAKGNNDDQLYDYLFSVWKFSNKQQFKIDMKRFLDSEKIKFRKDNEKAKELMEEGIRKSEARKFDLAIRLLSQVSCQIKLQVKYNITLPSARHSVPMRHLVYEVAYFNVVIV